MKIVPQLLTLTCLSVICFRKSDAAVPVAPKPNNKIIGGTIVDNREDFSYQVSIRQSMLNLHWCGASIIDSKHVLTAAQCVLDDHYNVVPTDALMVVVGDLDVIEVSETTVTKTISNIFVHKNFNQDEAFIHDIAVIRIKEEFEWTKNVGMVNLTDARPKDGTICKVSGWGVMDVTGQTSDKLQFVSVPVAPNSRCKTMFPPIATDGILCAGGEAGKDICVFDQGGPMVCDEKLAGIISQGSCATITTLGIYTDVTAYEDWINEQIEKSSASVPNVGMLFALFAIISYIIL